MAKKAMWLVYDLDSGGDCEGLYRWLDINEAKECGNGTAFLYFEFKDNFYQELKQSLEENIEVTDNDRVYVIYREPRKMTGKFIFGERKENPWARQAATDSGEEDMEEGCPQ